MAPFLHRHHHVLNSSPSASKSLSRLRLTIGMGRIKNNQRGREGRQDTSHAADSLPTSFYATSGYVLRHRHRHHDVHKVSSDARDCGDGATADCPQGACSSLETRIATSDVGSTASGFARCSRPRACNLFVQCASMAASRVLYHWMHLMATFPETTCR